MKSVRYIIRLTQPDTCQALQLKYVRRTHHMVSRKDLCHRSMDRKQIEKNVTFMKLCHE